MAFKRKHLSNHQNHNIKKIKLESRSNFSAIHHDLLDKILSCLNDFQDKIRFKHTCSSWFSVAKSHIKYVLDRKQSVPMLFIEGETNNDGLVFSLEENSTKSLLHNVPLGYSCIGSSGGWLLIMSSSGNLSLFHRQLGAKVALPPVHSFPRVDHKKKSKLIPKHWIKKFVIWGDPILEKDFGIVVLYGSWHTKLAFFKYGESKWGAGWANWSSSKDYRDIICHGDFIIALRDSGYIEKYRISDITVKVMKIKPSCSNNMTEFENDDLRDLYFWNNYVVESKGSILLVKRCIGKFVYLDGQVISEGDLIELPYCQFYCSYRTKNFYVYKLNLEKIMWEELTSLDDEVLFIGGNHSFSVSAKNCVGCNANSIYFTDDNWEEIEMAEEEDVEFRGHDIGVFNLTDGKVKDVYVPETGNMDASCWIL